MENRTRPSDLIQCNSQEIGFEGLKLQSTLNQALALAPDDGARRVLIEDQASWARLADQACDFPAVEGRSIVTVNLQFCRMDSTLSRIAQLRSQMIRPAMTYAKATNILQASAR